MVYIQKLKKKYTKVSISPSVTYQYILMKNNSGDHLPVLITPGRLYPDLPSLPEKVTEALSERAAPKHTLM